MPKLTKGESTLYWGLWGEYRKFLVDQKHWDAKRADAFRHELARRMFGYPLSSKDFTRRHLDRWKAVIKAHTEPDNIQLQLDIQEQGLKRARSAVWTLAKKLDLSTPYLEGMAQKICKTPLATATEPQLAKLLAALHIAHRRSQRKAQQPTNNPF